MPVSPDIPGIPENLTTNSIFTRIPEVVVV